jgi:hypothetical protein
MRTKSVWEIDQIPPEKMQDNLLLLISDHEAQITYTIRLGDLKKYIMGTSDDKPEFREEMEKKSPEILEDILGKEFNKFFEEISKLGL